MTLNDALTASVSRRALARLISAVAARCFATLLGREPGGRYLLSDGSRLTDHGPSSRTHADIGMLVDVRERGARGDGRYDDVAIVQSAIDDVRKAGGGTVFFPHGQYKVGRTLTIPAGSSSHVRLRGDTRRRSVIAGASAGQTVIRIGNEPGTSAAGAPPAYYGSVEDLTIMAGGAKSGRGLHLVQSALVTVARLNIEGFREAGGIGLHLEGSLTSGGLGAVATPHALDNRFYDLVIVDCERPLTLQNADENCFVALRIGLPIGMRGGAPRTGIDIRQGRNNRFFGTTIQGDVRDSRALVGIAFRSPVNARSEPNGDVKGNNFHGLVVEGCDVGVWFEASPNTAGNACRDVNFSMCRELFRDDGRQNGSGNCIDAPLHGIHSVSGPAAASDALTFPPNTQPQAAVTPSVRRGNVFACANPVPTRITGLSDGASGQLVVLRLDQNTTIAHGPSLRLAGGRDVAGSDDETLTLANFGGTTWFEVARALR